MHRTIVSTMVIMKMKARKTMNNSEKYRTILADEKPMGCPFCGASTEVVIDECGCYSISCIHCEYGSPAYNEEKYAIEAHNRICRAVAAYKESEVK